MADMATQGECASTALSSRLQRRRCRGDCGERARLLGRSTERRGVPPLERRESAVVRGDHRGQRTDGRGLCSLRGCAGAAQVTLDDCLDDRGDLRIVHRLRGSWDPCWGGDGDRRARREMRDFMPSMEGKDSAIAWRVTQLAAMLAGPPEPAGSSSSRECGGRLGGLRARGGFARGVPLQSAIQRSSIKPEHRGGARLVVACER